MKTVYAGKVAEILELPSPHFLRIGDDVTTGDGDNRLTIPGFGRLRARQAIAAFKIFETAGVPTHFVEPCFFDESAFFIENATHTLKLEVVVREFSDGSFAKRTGIPRGTALDDRVVEFFLKDDSRHDPRIQFEEKRSRLTREVTLFKASSDEQVGTFPTVDIFGGESGLQSRVPNAQLFRALGIKGMCEFYALQAFRALSAELKGCMHILVDAKFEFGLVLVKGKLVVRSIDRFTGDEARIWWCGNPNHDVGKQPLRDKLREVGDVSKLPPGFLAGFVANYELLACELEGIAQRISR